jgi:hypothetical protein
MKVLAGSLATVALLVGASSASADSATIGVALPDGTPDPVAYIPRVFSVSGAGGAGDNLYIKHHPGAGGTCAPSAYADVSGRLTSGFYGIPASGPFSAQQIFTWDAPGTWTFCMWLAPSETTVVSPVSQTITYRTPNGQINASVSPSVPTAGQRTTVTVSGTSEAPRRIWAKIRPVTGQGCAGNYDADPGRDLIEGWDANGAFAATRDATQTAAGRYLVCVWLAGSSYDPLPIAGPQALTFTVGRPLPTVEKASALDCRARGPVRRFHAEDVRSVCMRYRFASAPAPGAQVSISYVTPKQRTYKTVALAWAAGRSRTLTAATLPGRAYQHRRGVWRAVLRIGGQRVVTVSFKVL